MESDLEDVQRITQFINGQKTTNYQNNFQLEFQDFIAFRRENDDDEFPEDEMEDADIENAALSELSVQVSTTTLTEDEQQTIDSCTDPELKQLLILNRTKNMQLINLHKKLQDLVSECDEAIREKSATLKRFSTKQMHRHMSQYYKLAAPYFKDRKCFQCPPNEDTIKKRANNELTTYDLAASSKWTTIEISRLTNAVKFSYNMNRQNSIVRKINALKARTYDVEVTDANEAAEIRDLEEELQRVKDDDRIPPLNSNEYINWDRVSEAFLKEKHTATECQSVWHLLVHPDINKSEWTEEENMKLEAIAKRHTYQNWDAIATTLATKRTGFMTCLHYYSKLCDKFKRTKFTPEEDTLLMELVDMHRTAGNVIEWHKIVCHFDNRSRHQLYHRFTYFLSQAHVKRGKFTEAEDILLMVLVNRFGRNFKKCAEYMPHRSHVQLKSRYNSNLQREIKKGTFTVEDDRMILAHVEEHGERNWSGLTVKLSRCRAQIRQRYKLIKGFLDANPKARLKDIPKRKHNFDKGVEDQFGFLKYMAEQYKEHDSIPTLQMIEEGLQVKLEASQQDKHPKTNIDTLLTDLFVDSLKSKQNTAATNVGEATANVHQVLSLLNANLTLPQMFECNPHLDSTDVEILDNYSNRQSTQINTLVSPNVNTLVGLRSLIIKHRDYKQRNKNAPSTSKDVVWSMEQGLAKVPEDKRKDILHHRDLFSRRFDALFTWSAVLSLERPNHVDLETSEGDERKSSGDVCIVATSSGSNSKSATDICEVAATTGGNKRKLNRDQGGVVKKRKTAAQQLQTVDKNVVVERLIKSKKINLVQVATQQERAASSAVVEKIEINSEDMENDEYRAIEGDVQLLKEILKYEKIKSEPDAGI